MDPRGRGYRAIGWVLQKIQQSSLLSDLVGQRKNAKHRIGIQLLEKFLERQLQPRLFAARQHRDFKKANRAERQRFTAPHSRFESSQLDSRELPRVDQPSSQDMGIQQQTW